MPSTPAHLTDAFVARLEKHQRILFKVAYMYCRDRDDRQDLVQDMLIQVWRSYARFDDRVVGLCALTHGRTAVWQTYLKLPHQRLQCPFRYRVCR